MPLASQRQVVGPVLVISATLLLSPTILLPADDTDPLTIDAALRTRCLSVLQEGLASDEFWPAIHAAEGLTLGGYGSQVRAAFEPRLESETDLQRRCGLARELVRAGDRLKKQVLLDVLANDDSYGHMHAAESLYKICEIGNGQALRQAFVDDPNVSVRLMAAGALGRCGNPAAMHFLRQSLAADEPATRRIAAWLLGRIGDDSDIPRIRKTLPLAEDDLSRAYAEHSLAALGDDAGMKALARNLASSDPAIRTYAATFAGDVGAVHLIPQLSAMLDDPHLDARIRAAQSIFDLTDVLEDGSQKVRTAPDEDISLMLFEATSDHPRYTEGSVLELADGSLLVAVTEFSGSGSDFATAHIVGRQLEYFGKKQHPVRVLQPNTGSQNVMSVTLRRLQRPAPEGTIAMFYLQKNDYDDLDLKVRFSSDEGQSFGSSTLVTADPGYHVVNNDRVTQLANGRLLVPAASTPNVRTQGHFVAHCYLSDDGGKTWRNGKEVVDLPKRGAMEPEVFERADGRVLMNIRTQLGYIAKSLSHDGGETWSAPESLGLRAPEAPATLRRIPATGDLLLIWNDTFDPAASHGGKRTPLAAAISSDEGATWRNVGQLETDKDRTYSYTSLTFVRDRAVFTYWESGNGGRLSTRFRALPVRWFYRDTLSASH